MRAGDEKPLSASSQSRSTYLGGSRDRDVTCMHEQAA
jgi:hypothetical protein